MLDQIKQRIAERRQTDENEYRQALSDAARGALADAAVDGLIDMAARLGRNLEQDLEAARDQRPRRYLGVLLADDDATNVIDVTSFVVRMDNLAPVLERYRIIPRPGQSLDLFNHWRDVVTSACKLNAPMYRFVVEDDEPQPRSRLSTARDYSLRVGDLMKQAEAGQLDLRYRPFEFVRLEHQSAEYIEDIRARIVAAWERGQRGAPREAGVLLSGAKI